RYRMPSICWSLEVDWSVNRQMRHNEEKTALFRGSKKGKNEQKEQKRSFLLFLFLFALFASSK
ncbi:MAG: hypothetical protein J2P31_09930, partial [Blastocatellia bacterium]|nr:hypothetical protein [Blastocatellia bacterium]